MSNAKKNVKNTESLTLKKTTTLFLAFVFMVFGGACVTTGMWQDKNYKQKTFYETVSSFLVSADNKNIIVLGKDKHYVFAFPIKLQRILADKSISPHIKANFQTFKLYANTAKVNGYFYLVFKEKNITPDRQKQLKALGFYQSHKNKSEWRSHQKLTGTYYQAGNFKLPSNSRYLNQSYRVKMVLNTPKDQTARKVLLTPLTVLTDGLILIGSIPILIVGTVVN